MIMISKGHVFMDEGKKEKRAEFIRDAVFLVVAVTVTMLIVLFVAQRTVVSGHSMNPTLSDGDNLIVEKISYCFNDPKRFDVIVFPPHGEKGIFAEYYIKRVIGLPGETVKIDENGNIYINDVLLEENYGAEPIKSVRDDGIENIGLARDGITLGNDEFFVLGDNRNHSTDSRFESVGPVKRSIILGRAWIRFAPSFSTVK